MLPLIEDAFNGLTPAMENVPPPPISLFLAHVAAEARRSDLPYVLISSDVMEMKRHR